MEKFREALFIFSMIFLTACGSSYQPLSADQVKARDAAAREKMIIANQRMEQLKSEIKSGNSSEELVKKFLDVRCEYIREEEYLSSRHLPIPCQVKTVVLIESESVYIQRAQDALVRDFKDPASAQYRDVTFFNKDVPIVCGEVNGKNGYGAYVGFKRFYATDTPGFSATDDGSIQFEEVWLRVCDR